MNRAFWEEHFLDFPGNIAVEKPIDLIRDFRRRQIAPCVDHH